MNKVNELFSSIDISSSGLKAQRMRLDAISSNIANAHTTRTKEGGPYKRQITTFSENRETNQFTKMLTEERMKLNTTSNSHLLPENNLKYENSLSGVKAEIVNDQADPKVMYNPSHPDSDENGYVKMPDINIVSEMVDLISASRSYEANVTALNAAKGMAKNALMI